VASEHSKDVFKNFKTIGLKPKEGKSPVKHNCKNFN